MRCTRKAEGCAWALPAGGGAACPTDDCGEKAWKAAPSSPAATTAAAGSALALAAA
jgi:hypothetical protein